MSDNEKSLSDEATFDGGMQADKKDLQSLGDRSTLGGGDGSSVPDLGSIGDLPDHDMEIVDLSKRYRIEKSLGKGGMGEVLLATDTRLDRQVAIKRIRADVAVGKTAAARFLQEAKAVAALSHNNVVGVYDYGRDADGPFLIMEYVSGGSLLQRCTQGPIELADAINLACQLCEGLGRAHDAGIIHRDIKPANILLTDDGIPKLTDFGLAKADSRDHTMTMAGAVLGTLDFMPPEQRRDASLTDSRSDLWSLSATLYQMVTGKSPRIIRFIDVPTSLQEVLGKALEEEKEDRYQTAIELRDALRGSVNAPETVIQTSSDLRAGECPSCHSRNDASRKFCNGCGRSLRVPCLSCEAEIPIWERFCGECGGNQQQLLDSRLEEIEKQKVEAEDLRGHYKYEAALVIAQEISEIQDGRFSKLRLWGREFTELVKGEWNKAEESATQHYSEAKTHRDAFDYDSAIHAIESIPEPMRSSEINGYLSSLTSDRDESVELIRTIRESISNRKLDGLLSKVERALELRGDREDLIKLRTKLVERQAKQIQKRDKLFLKAPITNSIGMQLKHIPAGTFTMGSENGYRNEKPAHQVTLSQPFLLGVHEVTQAQYEQVMGSNPSKHKGPRNPVEMVSWDDAVEFCRKLSALPKELAARRSYRLPTEAEWEYCCRARSTTKYGFGDDESDLVKYAWYEGNSGDRTHPVGQKQPNAWGLYDMHGNVWEWCADRYGGYPSGSVTDPTGPQSGSRRVLRGGRWRDDVEDCRSTVRSRNFPSGRFGHGLRVACVPSGQ